GAPARVVREAWDGLGYYARARNLHELAKCVTRRHDGTLPDEPEELRELPGVGPYTAGAVASFAYEKPVPAVDTNVSRVLRRVFFGRATLKDALTVSTNSQRATAVWGLAGKLVPQDRKGARRCKQATTE